MPIKAVVSDWNGTLFKHATDEVQNKKLAYAVLSDAKKAVLRGRVWRLKDMVGLLKTKSELQKRLQEYKEDKRYLWEVYQPFNDGVLKGRPVAFIKGVIDEYAKESDTLVDRRILGPLRLAHMRGVSTAILSVSYDYSIRRILGEAGYAGLFDTIVANTLQTEGSMAIGLTLGIYGLKKEVFYNEFLQKRGFQEDSTLYFGDTEDDEPIASMLSPGNFIVPFFAIDEFKQRMAAKHQARVLENEEDMQLILQ